ncbi:TIR domain-containing protein [Alcaligenes faecalis]|uniref:Nucleotide-binding protein n=1 Tax=Alcaligenes faecalis TaxID=511 RepID=A0AAE9H565_ALCFA|nr:TIR domain-containing protein [Alcaligenes faecalis]UPL20168.1 nucleotide-binding protein [Alcaligenes faecalis]
MSLSERIEKESARLDKYLDYDCTAIDRLLSAAEKVGRSWSGSWLGYQSRVYYEGFDDPPPGAHFSIEWGLYSGYDSVGLCSVGNWREYPFQDVIKYIESDAGNPDLGSLKKDSNEAIDLVDDVKSNVLSLLHSKKSLEEDNFLQKLISKLEELKAPSQEDFLKNAVPKGQFSTRDQRVEHKIITPPHKQVECISYGILAGFATAKEVKKILLRISNYLGNMEDKMEKTARIGVNVFIGHGRSSDWRDLKDFINERLSLPWDEFNRVPVAGLTNITRLAQMLDQSCIAFIVMTAEDEQADGSHHARMNVVHEAGLFQGRLGFEKAVVLLEEGCEEFSNIQGLGQIRYPKGKISAIFEDVRRVLEREGIIDAR